jgi:5-(carboxyamino)imidazole ribonucleotide synthase
MRIGILGAGQLGRMLALAGYPLGLQFRFWEAAGEAPAGMLAECLRGSFADRDLLQRFAAGLDVVTYEFENVPAETARHLSALVPVYPSFQVLEIAQDRLNEKLLFQGLGIPVPAFAPVQDTAELHDAVQQIGLPAVLKTRRGGYDGKGQMVLRTSADVERAGQTLGRVPLLLEQLVPFEREVSVVAVRGRDGEVASYPLVENRHHEGILRQSQAPAPGWTQTWQTLGEGHVRRILEAVEYAGVLAVEFFQYQGQLLANEMAPRVHNSGHWTIEGARTSQFANHLRAVLGLPLGSTAPLGHAAMLNLIGAVPPLETLLAIPGLNVHLYGKTPHRGRKLGHLTLVEVDEKSLQRKLALLWGRSDLPGLWLEDS